MKIPKSPSAFLHTENDKEVIIKMQDCQADLMEAMPSQLSWKFVITDAKGQAVLYMKLQ